VEIGNYVARMCQ